MLLLISLSLVTGKLSKLHAHGPEFCGLAFLRLHNELHFVAPAFRTLAGVHQCQSIHWHLLCIRPCARMHVVRQQTGSGFAEPEAKSGRKK